MFTLRELVAFVCWRSLERSQTTLRKFNDSSSTTVRSGYTDIVRRDVGQSGKRAASLTARRQSKRTRPQPSTEGSVVSAAAGVGWSFGELVALDMQHPERAPSRDSGYYESVLPISTDVGNQRPFLSLKSEEFLVTQVLSPAVAVLSPVEPASSISIVAKIPFSLLHENAELDAYDALVSLQGTMVPYCYGTAKTKHGLVILTEFIAPATTIDALRVSGEWARLERLRYGAMAAVRCIHELGVLHRDAHGNNILVCSEDELVLVDFDAAKVYDDKNIALDKGFEDRAIVAAAFAVPAGVVEESDEDVEQ